jgi:ATP-dependent Zn protease
MTEYEIGLLISAVLIAGFYLTGWYIQRVKRANFKKSNPQIEIDRQKEEIISLIEDTLSDAPQLRTSPLKSKKIDSQINIPFPNWVKWAIVLSFIPLIVGAILFFLSLQTGNTPVVPYPTHTTVTPAATTKIFNI